MPRRAASFVLLCALAAALLGCSSDKPPPPPTADSNAVPTRYKEEIIDTLKKLFDKNDTGSVTGAMLSDPALEKVGGDQHYAACVRYTAHSTSDNMAANVERIAYFYGGHLNQLVETAPGQCRNAPYKPFPELDQVCLGKGCK